MKTKFMAQSDMAKRWGVSRKVVNNWSKRDDRFPKPVQVVACGTMPIYKVKDIEAYEEKKGVAVIDQGDQEVTG